MGIIIKNVGLFVVYSVASEAITMGRKIESGYYTVKYGIEDILRKDEH